MSINDENSHICIYVNIKRYLVYSVYEFIREEEYSPNKGHTEKFSVDGGHRE